jgi:hypothetical protein
MIAMQRIAPTDHAPAHASRYDGAAEAAQRLASTAPLAASIDGTTRWHGTRMKNAPSLGTRQRRQLRAMLGGRLTEIYYI